MAFRAHPLTKRAKQYTLQCYAGPTYGWEEVITTTDPKEFDKAVQRQDRDRPSEETRIITKTVDNPDHGRFKVGQKVKVHPATDAFMQGLTYGEVTHVGRKWITVAWTMNKVHTRKFSAGYLEPETEWESQYL